MTSLFTTINYQYQKPSNFDQAKPEFDIFKNLKVAKCTAPRIHNFKKIRVSNNSVIYNYCKIFKGSCVNGHNYIQYQKNHKFFLKYCFPKINFSKKKFILITDEWTSNYYHWHMYALVRLLALREAGLMDESLLILPEKYKKCSYAMASLKRFGVKDEQIVYLSGKANMKVAELNFVTAYHQQPIAFNKMRQVLTEDVKPLDMDLGDKIYISRSDQPTRFVENETEVVAFLEQHGFKKILANEYSYEEQIAICSKAKYVISPHGAGLTNLLFVPKGGFVLELCTRPDANKLITDYFRLSNMLDIHYLYQECERGASSENISGYNPIKGFHHSSLEVDLDKLGRNIALMFESGQEF